MSASQQEIAIERDKERLRYKAEQNVIRNLRFRDARWRTIGIDEQALREQIKDNERRRNEDKEDARIERLRNEEYDRILQAAQDEEAYLRKLQSDDVRRTWEEQMALKKNTPEIDDAPSDFAIGYEDPLAKERERAQKEQMSRWAQEQALQNKQRKSHEKDEDLAYSDMLRAIDEIRGVAEEEEAKMRKELSRKLREDNLALAEEQRRRKKNETPDGPENNTLPLYTSAGGKDNFRGFDDAKRKEILKENERLIAFKREMEQRERDLDAAWHQEQLLAAQAMTAAEMEERQMRDLLKKQQRDLLQAQLEERRSKEEREKAERGEPIGDGFFDGFGVIWR